MKHAIEKKPSAEMTAKQYSELLKCIDIRDIYLLSSKTSVRRDAFRGKAKLDFGEKVNIRELTPDEVQIEVGYSLRAKSGRSQLFNIAVSFMVVFATKREIPREFFDIYNNINLPLQLFPYFREFAQLTISRMGLPPLVIPLRKFLISKD